MAISRSTYYATPASATDDTAIVEAIAAICDEFEYYGWRRVQAALRQQGMIVNHKKIKRLMREHDLQPRMRRRYVATTDSDHDQPIFPNRAKDITVDGPDQLWVSDITYVAIASGFVYVSVILDAWSRRVVGYAISRSIDVRLTQNAVVVGRRKPGPKAAESYREMPTDRQRLHTFLREQRRDRHTFYSPCRTGNPIFVTPTTRTKNTTLARSTPTAIRSSSRSIITIKQ